MAAINDLAVKCMDSYADAGSPKINYHIKSISSVFQLDENGALQFSDKIAAQIDSAGKCYAVTEKGQAVHQFIQAIAAAWFDNNMSNYFPNRLDVESIKFILDTSLLGIDAVTQKALSNILPRLRYGNMVVYRKSLLLYYEY